VSKEKIKVKVNGDLADIMPIFLDRLGQDILTMPQAIQKEDFKEIAAFAHKLRGNGPSYEIHEFGYMGSELEKLAKAKDLAQCRKVFDRVKDYFERLEIIFVD
jgi:HPt (histidine-containing phosphotransfer) domain-containing protein